MAITNLLAPIPKWVLMNNQGEAAGGAKLYTYRSLNKIQQKAVYQDAGGTIPWTNPIIFDANGTQGPFYWQVDSANLNDTYYLEAYDSDDNLLWTLDDYAPPGAGGGGNVTTYLPLSNMIANNVFIEHIDDTANPIGVTNLLIAPSNHHGFTPDLINPVVGTYGVVGPDARFVKNNTAATDQITFPAFGAGNNPLTGDVTPVDYVRYQCTNSPLGESYKSFQFPICQKVKNLETQDLTFTCWARVAVSAVTLTVYLRQYFGSGGAPSAEVRTNVGTMTLSTTWTKFNISINVPTTALKTLGTCGDDATYIQLEMPLGAPCDVWFTKPSLYLGTLDPDQEFADYDQIDSIIQTPRTAEIKTSIRTSPPKGWIAMDDRSIGSATSGATNRANIDTFFLFKTIWDSVSNTYAPLQDNAGVPTARGASAVADFNADRRLVLTKALGRVFAGNGIYQDSLTFTADAATDLLTVSSTADLLTGTPILVSNSGGALPTPLLSGVVYYVINVSGTTLKVAQSVDLAQAGTGIDITANGSGTNTILPALGATFGEGLHVLSTPEIPSHTHGIGANDSGLGNVLPAGDLGPAVGFTFNTNATGGGLGHNTLQPTTFYNVFIKL